MVTSESQTEFRPLFLIGVITVTDFKLFIPEGGKTKNKP